MSRTRDILDLLERGFTLYTGHVPEEIYREKRCRTPKNAEWFCRPWSEANKVTRYICLGCRKRCVATDPVGWQLMLPISKTRPSAVAFAPAWPLTAEELLRIRKVLRVDEVLFVLNVGKTTVYAMIEDGRLDALPEAPLRVTVESIRRCFEDLRR